MPRVEKEFDSHEAKADYERVKESGGDFVDEVKEKASEWTEQAKEACQKCGQKIKECLHVD